MPKRSNFRGTTRKLYNPSEVKYLDAKEIRSEYAALRKIANRRADRLKQAGFGETSLAKEHFAPQSALSDEQVKTELLEVSRFLRDPRSTRPGMREYDKAIKESLAKYEDVIAKNPKKFGDFMESARRRAGGRLADSARVRASYEQAVARGMQPKTLEKHFGQYLNDVDKLDKLSTALYNAPTTGRLTIAKLEALL